MGIFFRSAPTVVQVRTTTPPPGQELPEQMQAEVVEEGESSKPIWGRLIFATVILAAIFAGCIYTAHDEKLADLYKLLLHSFELLLGAFIGILTGEFVSKKN
jgi:hypothetical protein